MAWSLPLMALIIHPECVLKVLKVFIESGAVDKEIIHVYPRPLSLGQAHHLVHHSLERSRRVGEPERHHRRLIEPSTSHKRGDLGGLWCERDLPEFTAEVHLQPKSGLPQALKALVCV